MKRFASRRSVYLQPSRLREALRIARAGGGIVRPTTATRVRSIVVAVLVMLSSLAAAARADPLAAPLFPQQAEAARLMVVLGVQQGISSLPPTSGQSASYEFDPQRDTYIRSSQLGPLAFRSPQTLGEGRISVRLAGSYFELPAFSRSIPYAVNEPAGTPLGVGQLGLRLDSQPVGIINLATAYGVSNRFDVAFNLPIVVVGSDAGPIFSTRSDALNGPPAQAVFSGVPISNGDIQSALTDLNDALKQGLLALRTQTFHELGYASLFNEGTHVGVGRISVGGKLRLYTDKHLDVAAVPEFFFPSPNENEFAGSGSAAILPRVVAAVRVAPMMRLHIDAGYDYDFDHDELRRFTWNTGASIPIHKWAVLDFGVGGSKFNSGIMWTPTTASFAALNGSGLTLTALGDNRLASNFVDFLGGVKVRIADSTILAGTVNVPLTNEGYRAVAVGTLAVERYF